MRKKMRKMMRKIASVLKIAVMCKIMRKTMRKIDVMCKMLRNIVFMRKMMRKMKILSSKGKYSRSEQHKTFKFHLLAQNIYCLSN